MSMRPGPGWIQVGATSNAAMFEAAPDLLAIVPDEGCVDTQATARESIAFQDGHWRRRGLRGAVVCFMDAVVEQDGGARAVYATETGQTLTTCYALVGETFYARSVSAVFTGLARPPVPTRIFRSLEDALPWIAEMNRERGGVA
jgi:hypothetical protein